MHALPYRDRLRTIAAAARREGALREQARWSRAELRAHQQARLDEIVRHALAHSPVYRDRLGGLDPGRRVALGDLPPVTKDELMERFDDWVADPRLRGGAVQA